MDLLEKGKQYARNGDYEKALDNFMLALENDKENSDIHFFIGHCYSSLEQFGYAKFHYEVAQTLDPNNPKLNVIWDTIKNVQAEKPPERKITRAAAAKERRAQSRQTSDEISETSETFSHDETTDEYEEHPAEPKIKVTDEKWEQAFPMDEMAKIEDDSGSLVKISLYVLLIGILGAGLYFALTYFGVLP